MTAAFRLVIDCAEPEGLAGLGATMIAVSQEGTDNYAGRDA